MWDLHTTTDMRFFLLVCLLMWPGITSADETSFITVAEGDDAVLPCSLSSKENIEQMIFDWKKDGGDQKQVFYYVRGSHYNNGRSGQDEQFKGRVSHFQDELEFGNASIKISNTDLADNGSYTCIFPEKQKSHITLYVGAASKPSVTILGVTENGTLLQCEVRRASPKPDVVWQDHAGNIIPSHKPQMTERGGSYDIILLTTVTKTDYYSCTTTQEEIKHQVSAKIYVPVIDAVSKPSVTILGVTEDGTLLQCEVRHASPKLDVVWQDHAGNIIPSHKPKMTERGGSYDIILLTTVTKTDYYSCTTTQEEIKHQVSAKIYVPVIDTSTPWIIAGVLGVVLLVFVIGAVLYVHLKQNYKKDPTSNSESARLNGNGPSG